jgi:hypothetical protein
MWIRSFLINSVEDIDAGAISGEAVLAKSTHYARPPQMPSKLMSRKTNMMLRPSESSEKMPTADSNPSVSRMKPCRIDGNARKRGGSGGMPREMEEREKNTKVWYTS